MDTTRYAPVFNKDTASTYDNQRAKLAPMKDALHLVTRIVFSELPDNANILCVGVGTGAELLYLAQAFPGWRFSVVEPAPAMMKICQQKVEDLDFTSRCTFHEGYLDSLPEVDPFDASTSFLVSHFMMDQQKRIQYFADIAARLKPGACLVNVDLAGDMDSVNYASLIKVWRTMHEYSGMPSNIEAFGHAVAFLPTDQVQSIIEAGGFESSVLFYQSLFIHAWYSKRSNA